MGNTKNIRVNQLPARTWNKLKMNETYLDLEMEPVQALYREELPEGVDKLSGKAIGPMTDIPVTTGLGEAFDSVLADTGVKPAGYSIEDGVQVEKPLYIFYGAEGKPAAKDEVSLLDFTIGANSSLTVIQDITDTGADQGHTLLLQNKYHIAEGGSLTIVQVNRLGKAARLCNDLGGYVADRGQFKLIQVILGGGKNYYGSNTKLSGKGSSISIDVAYSLDGEATLDMNYVADHRGKNTESNIGVSGVMKGRSKKLFRGTIDFHRGCAGAKGAEIEDVLLIDDTIVNQTIPLILCDEEDVEGAHGATIGRLDEHLLTYMKSRGISEKDAYKLMEKAKIDAVVNKIEDDRIKGIIREHERETETTR